MVLFGQGWAEVDEVLARTHVRQKLLAKLVQGRRLYLSTLCLDGDTPTSPSLAHGGVGGSV